MADFAQAISKTLAAEGGYVNIPSDPGGETKFGICKRDNPDVDIKNLTPEQASDIYKKSFWVPLRLDEVKSQAVANELFDTAVNTGMSHAVHFLQEALGLLMSTPMIVDGVLGSKTIATTNSYPYPGTLVKVMNALQFEYYRNLVDKRPEMHVFFRGWMARIEFHESVA